MKKILYIMIGCISLGLGIIGVILPILPTVPFVLLAAFVLQNQVKDWMVGLRIRSYIGKTILRVV